MQESRLTPLSEFSWDGDTNCSDTQLIYCVKRIATTPLARGKGDVMKKCHNWVPKLCFDRSYVENLSGVTYHVPHLKYGRQK